MQVSVTSETYNQIIQIVHLFNKKINKEETYYKIIDILSKDNTNINSNLKEKFNLLFK